VAKRVLVVGFEPFGEVKVSASELVARSFEGKTVAGRLIAVRVIPAETRNIRERFETALREDNPDVVVLLSSFGGRFALSMERVAVNVLDFDAPDAVGVMRKGDVISRGGADARISNVPFEKIVEAWSAQAVPGYTSNSAGTAMGNQALYEMLGLTEQAMPPIVVGLVHLPYLPAAAIAAGADSNPSMSLDLMKKGIETMIETIVPWVDQRSGSDAGKPQAAAGQTAASRSTWIPRGVKEVER
jgi:pyroglutamyl-peptidase